jgi:hypothetical protein
MEILKKKRSEGEALDRVEEGEESCGGDGKTGAGRICSTQERAAGGRRKENCGRVESKSDHFIAEDSRKSGCFRSGKWAFREKKKLPM